VLTHGGSYFTANLHAHKTDTFITKTLPAEIQEGLDGVWYCWSGAWPRQKVKLCDVAQLTGLDVTYREVADDKVVTATANVRRQ